MVNSYKTLCVSSKTFTRNLSGKKNIHYTRYKADLKLIVLVWQVFLNDLPTYHFIYFFDAG